MQQRSLKEKLIVSYSMISSLCSRILGAKTYALNMICTEYKKNCRWHAKVEKQKRPAKSALMFSSGPSFPPPPPPRQKTYKCTFPSTYLLSELGWYIFLTTINRRQHMGMGVTGRVAIKLIYRKKVPSSNQSRESVLTL